MTPPKAQVAVAPAVRAGRPPIIVVAAPPTHGVGAGTHGIGVSTPSAAEVALATVGLASEEHIPKLGMFTRGAESVIVAAGLPSISTRLVGSTARVVGATPKLHWSIAVAAAAGRPMSHPTVLDRGRQQLPGGRHETGHAAVPALLPAACRGQQIGKEQGGVAVVDAHIGSELAGARAVGEVLEGGLPGEV